MKYTGEELIFKARQALSSLPCEFAEIRISSGTGTGISLSGKETDSMTSGDSTGGSVRVLKNGAWGFVSFTKTDDLEQRCRQALDTASALEPEKKVSVVHTSPVTGHYTTPCIRRPSSVSLDEKFSLISRYNNILGNSEKIQSTRAVYSDSESIYIYVNSDGSALSWDRSWCGISLTAIARDGSLIIPYGDSSAARAGFETVLNKETEAEDVLKTATDMLSAESAPGKVCSVIADQRLAGVFIHEAFGHLSEADFIHENPGLQKIMQTGRKFGPEELNVLDDGTIQGLPGFLPFDDEGILPKKTALINSGILSGRLHSRETSAKMGEEPSGNGRAISTGHKPIVRMTNTYIENGSHSTEELFDSVQDGIYAVSMIGGQTNLERFTFTAGYGYEIKNGRKGKMYREIQLSGNVFTTLKNIRMIGNDKKMFGGLGGCGKSGQSPLPVSFGGPHILIDGVLTGGGK